MSNTGMTLKTFNQLREAIVHVQQLLDEQDIPESKQWEPRDGEFTIHGDGGVFLTGPHNRSPSYISAGMVRKTKAAADKASAAMRTHNHLLAYVDEFGGGWVADWSDSIQQKYALRYNNESNEWGYSCATFLSLVGTVYMSKQCVEDLIIKLESGEVVL